MARAVLETSARCGWQKTCGPACSVSISQHPLHTSTRFHVVGISGVSLSDDFGITLAHRIGSSRCIASAQVATAGGHPKGQAASAYARALRLYEQPTRRDPELSNLPTL